MVVVIILSFIIGKWVTQSSNNLSNCTQSWTSIAIFFYFLFLEYLFLTIIKPSQLAIVLLAIKYSQYFDYCRLTVSFGPLSFVNSTKIKPTKQCHLKVRIFFRVAVLILCTYTLQSINRSRDIEYTT